MKWKRPPINPNPWGLPIIWGWENIAKYLGVGKRTLIENWKKWRLPLIRLSGRSPSRHMVGILIFDLEIWLLNCLRETLQFYLSQEHPSLFPCPPKNAPAYIKALYRKLDRLLKEEAQDVQTTQKTLKRPLKVSSPPRSSGKLLPLFPHL